MPVCDLPASTDHPWVLPSTVPATVRAEPREHLKGYFAAVTAMDADIGRILDKLVELDQRQSTLVCFMSDNGFNCGHHGIWGKGNGTFPQNMYDTSVKVPAIMSHPGLIPQGRVSAALLSGYDFLPTLLDYIGIEAAPDERLPGGSFLPVLSGAGDERPGKCGGL